MWFPLAKASEETERGERRRVLAGPISAEAEDGVKDIVVQDGMDCQPLLDSGYVNWDHADGPGHLVGEPVSVRPTAMHPDGRVDPRGPIPATWGRVLLYQGHPEADAIWTLAQAQQRSPEAKRRLGFSVQGEVLEKQGHRITKSRIRHLAVSHQPLMPLSFAQIAKSLRAADDAALQTLNLDGAATWGPCTRGHPPCYDPATGIFPDGVRGILTHWVQCRGDSLPHARRVIRGLAQSLRPRKGGTSR